MSRAKAIAQPARVVDLATEAADWKARYETVQRQRHDDLVRWNGLLQDLSNSNRRVGFLLGICDQALAVLRAAEPDPTDEWVYHWIERRDAVIAALEQATGAGNSTKGISDD